MLQKFSHLLHRTKKIEFIEQFSEKMLVKQEGEDLQIVDVHSSSIILVPETKSNPNPNPNPDPDPDPDPNPNPNPDQVRRALPCAAHGGAAPCGQAWYATPRSNPGLADLAPGRSATHTCEPALAVDSAAGVALCAGGAAVVRASQRRQGVSLVALRQ